MTKCFLGNGFGVSNAGLGYYERMIKSFSPADASTALRSFADPTVSSILRSTVGQNQWNALLAILDTKVTSVSDRDLLSRVESFSGTPDQLRLDTAIKKLAVPDTK